MDKKNTMLLTVIAVATLLVAVVGATFAYFSLTVGGDTTTTNATVTTGKVGTVTIAGSSDSYVLSVTAQDMAKGSEDIKYYAIKSTDTGAANEGEATGGKWVKTASEGKGKYTIATATLSGADENAEYTCNVTVNVKLSGEMTTAEQGKLKTGDAFLKIEGLPDVTGLKDEIDLSKILDDASQEAGKDYTGTLPKLNSSTQSATVTASLWLVNKSADTVGEQNYLAGEDLNVTIQVKTGGACTITTAPGE